MLRLRDTPANTIMVEVLDGLLLIFIFVKLLYAVRSCLRGSAPGRLTQGLLRRWHQYCCRGDGFALHSGRAGPEAASLVTNVSTEDINGDLKVRCLGTRPCQGDMTHPL